MKTIVRLATLLLIFAPATAALQGEEEGFITLFNGKDLDGWKSNEEKPGCFAVLPDGVLQVKGGRAHLFYVGPDGKPEFGDFEFRAQVKTTPGSNSGVFFHTKYQEKGWPQYGYEAQVNSTHRDPRKTGSIYAVKDVMNDAPSKDGEWFDYLIRVEGQRIVIKVNGKVVVDYLEPEDRSKDPAVTKRLHLGKTFAIQGHDRKSITFYRNIRVKKLP